MNRSVQRDRNILIVMRHSKRIDQYPNFAPDLSWNEKDEYCRPYDSPLCDFKLPIEKMKEVESFIPTMNITKIIVSPYLRCIQTATVIAKYLQTKTCLNFEIDARLGENALAVNRCIKHAKKKQNAQKIINYNIPKHYTDVQYLTMDEIKETIIDLYNQNEENNELEEKHIRLSAKDLKINWIHKEKAGNHLHIECAKEYKNVLIEERQLAEKHRMPNDYLMITHGQVVSDISEALCGKILSVDECGWFCITHNETVKVYSPTSVKILFDKNLELDPVKGQSKAIHNNVSDFEKLLNAYKASDCKEVFTKRMNIQKAVDLLKIKLISPTHLEEHGLSSAQQIKIYQLYYAVCEHHEKYKTVDVRTLLNEIGKSK